MMSRESEIDKINKTYLEFMSGTKHDIDIGEFFVDNGIGTKDRFEIIDQQILLDNHLAPSFAIKPIEYKK